MHRSGNACRMGGGRVVAQRRGITRGSRGRLRAMSNHAGRHGKDRTATRNVCALLAGLAGARRGTSLRRGGDRDCSVDRSHTTTAGARRNRPPYGRAVRRPRLRVARRCGRRRSVRVTRGARRGTVRAGRSRRANDGQGTCASGRPSRFARGCCNAFSIGERIRVASRRNDDHHAGSEVRPDRDFVTRSDASVAPPSGPRGADHGRRDDMDRATLRSRHRSPRRRVAIA